MNYFVIFLYFYCIIFLHYFEFRRSSKLQVKKPSKRHHDNPTQPSTSAAGKPDLPKDSDSAECSATLNLPNCSAETKYEIVSPHSAHVSLANDPMFDSLAVTSSTANDSSSMSATCYSELLPQLLSKAE